MNNFLKAIDILKFRGWIRHKWENDKGVCLSRAVALAEFNNAQFEALALVCLEEYGTADYVRANDMFMKSINEPIEMLRRASLSE